MKKILITGASGQVGKSLQQHVSSNTFDCHFLSRKEFDLSQLARIKETLSSIQPDFIINAAAYTQVDQAEDDQDLAVTVNTQACRVLADYAATHNAAILHYSSDYIYHNGIDKPLVETDIPSPKSVYASTKLAGEQAIQAACVKYFILRTSWVYDAYGSNFVKTMLALSDKYPKLTVVDDQIGSPTYAPDIAEVTWNIVTKYFAGQVSNDAFGIYNFSNEGVCSWYDFALAIFELAEKTIEVQPVPSTAYPRPAARPHYSVLNKMKIRAFLPDYNIPHWRTSLEKCLKEMSASV